MASLTSSHVRGPTEAPLIEQSLGAYLETAAKRWPDREALVVRHQGIRWSFAELDRRAGELAAGLLALGLEPGERVAIWSPNNAEWVLSLLACAKAGMILVCMNPAYRLAEIEYALNKAGCSALITAVAFRSSDYIAMLNTLLPELGSAAPGQLKAAKVPGLRYLISIGPVTAPGFTPFDSVAGLARPEHRTRLAALVAASRAGDALTILFTSGTTGAPKGATLSHRNILNNGLFMGSVCGMAEGDRMCVPVPLFHVGGMVCGVMCCVTRGATIVFPAEWFDPLATLEAMQEEACTALIAVPTILIALLNHPDFARFDLRSMRTGVTGGSPVPIEVMKRCISEMHLRHLTIIFGMTETGGTCMQTATDDTLERRTASIGRVHPHLEVKVIDAQGNTVPPGVSGEVCVRGYSVMLGYWGDEAKTAEAIDADGWMHTGDLGVLDEEGYGRIVGRIKDMVIRGGENIYPAEIENFLFRHPAIATAQVFGVPDERFGEELCAWLSLKPNASATEEEIRDFCRGQIAHFKIPRYIRFVTEFPTTPSGKVQKFAMRAAMVEALGLAPNP
jgi:fatty-acyl-CoA synthase